jgi:hypothetical protein
MEQIKQTTLKKAIVLLNAIGAQYAIIDTDGEKHGNLEVIEQRKRRKGLYKHGELTAYCMSNFKELAVGDVLIFPIGPYPIKDMQRTLSSWICKQYGNSTHTTCMSEDRQSIEVLRVA